MTKLSEYKFETGEILGHNCSIVEKNISKERADYLCNILTINGYEVRVQEMEQKAPPAAEGEDPAIQDPKYIVGVTDIRFNPVMEVYKRKMKNMDGDILLPAEWEGHRISNEWYWKENLNTAPNSETEKKVIDSKAISKKVPEPIMNN